MLPGKDSSSWPAMRDYGLPASACISPEAVACDTLLQHSSLCWPAEALHVLDWLWRTK